MKAKDLFLKNSYEKLEKSIKEISDEYVKDIYAISFYFYAEDDDLRFPTIEVSYNTNENVKNETQNASSEMEAKWNYAFWLQEEIERVGGEDDELLQKWFKDTPYYFTDEEDEEAEDDDELFDKLLDQGEKFDKEFIDGIIEIVQRLFSNNVIELKFGKNIPILIHELEYYDTPINWTKKANAPELIEEFLKAVENDM